MALKVFGTEEEDFEGDWWFDELPSAESPNHYDLIQQFMLYILFPTSSIGKLCSHYQGHSPSLFENVPVSPSFPKVASLLILIAPDSAVPSPLKLFRLVAR